MVAKDASVFQRYAWETVIVDEGARGLLLLKEKMCCNHRGCNIILECLMSNKTKQQI